MFSKRKFYVVGFEGTVAVTEVVTISDLFDKKAEAELIYSLQEITDKILDLKVGESLFIDLTRDGDNKGVILRTE